MSARRKLAVFLLTLAAGAAYELGCTFWVHHAERLHAGSAVAWSCFNAIVTIIGVEAFLQHRLFKIAYVIGFGAGTFAAIEIVSRWSP